MFHFEALGGHFGKLRPRMETSAKGIQMREQAEKLRALLGTILGAPWGEEAVNFLELLLSIVKTEIPVICFHDLFQNITSSTETICAKHMV